MSEIYHTHAQVIARELMLDEKIVRQKFRAFESLGMTDVLQMFAGLANVCSRLKEEIQTIKDRQTTMGKEEGQTTITVYGPYIKDQQITVQTGATLNFGGTSDVIDAINRAKQIKSQEQNNEELSDLEKALRATASMAGEGYFKMQKLYIGAFQIIKERIASDLDTASFCRLMAKKTELSEDLLPKNDNIRKIYFKGSSKYPNWKIEGESVETIQDIIDIAAELLRRL